MKIFSSNNKNIIITVYNLKRNINNDNGSDNIICPDCKNLTFLNFNDNNINNCKNKHMNEKTKEYTSITEFMNGQDIDDKEIKCSVCNNNKNLYGDNFYICSCQKKLNYVFINMKKVMNII